MGLSILNHHITETTSFIVLAQPALNSVCDGDRGRRRLLTGWVGGKETLFLAIYHFFNFGACLQHFCLISQNSNPVFQIPHTLKHTPIPLTTAIAF